MSADPLPITQPLIVAAIAAVQAGLFACADTALTSLSHARLAALAQEAKPRFRKQLERAVRRRAVLQSRYLAGRVSALVITAATLVLWLEDHIFDTMTWVAVGGGLLLLLSILLEICAAYGRRAADWVLPWVMILLWPLELVVAPLAFLTSGFTHLFKWRRVTDRRVTETEVELMIDQHERSGTLEHEPAELLRNVLEFSELFARDAMVPRTRMTAIAIDTPIDDILRVVTDTGHSRYPVYREDMDDIFGLLYAKDLFRVAKHSWYPPPAVAGEALRRDARLLDIVREPVKFVSETQPLSALLQEMRQDRQHMAVVVDEFGGTSGIVTLEDVLEEIVGDIQDEHDSEEPPIVELGQGRIEADAAVLVSELSAYLGEELDPEEKYDSLGGMLTDKLGAVPEPGTSVVAFGLRFIVRESDEKHISKVEIVRTPRADTSGPHRAAS